MLTTNVAKVSLTEIQDYFAKSVLVKMRTSIVRTKHEMWFAVMGDAPLYCIAIVAAKILIFLKSLAVNADFPADAAAVLALVGKTFKFFVVFRCVQFHNNYSTG